MAQCPHCQQDAGRKKKFNWWVFAGLGILTWGIASVVYLIVYATKQLDACVACGKKVPKQYQAPPVPPISWPEHHPAPQWVQVDNAAFPNQTRLGNTVVATASGQGADPRYSARPQDQAPLEILPGELDRAVGINGTVVVFENKVAILRRRDVLTAVLQGMKGDKELRLSKISSIQLRKPSQYVRGYIQFEVSGGLSSQRGVLDATMDENSVLMDPQDFDNFVHVKKIIEDLMDKQERRLSPTPTPTSHAQELRHWKELADVGTISKDEYEAKKKQILAR